MIFLTKLGICVLGENIEIRAFEASSTATWSILAQYRAGPEIESKASIFGSSMKSSSPWFYVASFASGAGVDIEIGKAMQTIADSYAASATTCDLRDTGSIDAWKKMSELWNPLKWP